MPPLPAVANAFRTRLLFDMNGKADQGVRFFNRWSGTPPTGGAANNLATLIWTAAGTHLASKMHPTNKLTGVILEDLTSDMGAVGEQTGTTPGTRATHTPLPVDAAFVTGYEIARRYRGGRPKSFWPFGDSNDLHSPNLWTPSAVTEFTTAVTAFLAAVHGSSSGGCTIGPHISIGYYHGFTVVTNPQTGRARNVPNVRTTPKVTDVTAILGRQYIGSARRRRLVS